MVSTDSRTCPACRRTSHLQQVQVAAVYEGIAKALVRKLKFAGTQAAARQMARAMLPPRPLAVDVVIVPVSTAGSRVCGRGYDQARLLARELARRTGQPHIACLPRIGQEHQVGASRHQRVTQLTHAFRARRSAVLRGVHIVLVDNVVTTGSTLEAAAGALKAAGARRIDAAVFAQA